MPQCRRVLPAAIAELVSLNALIAGDLVFQNIYPWLGEHTAERRQEWIKSLDQLIAMKPSIVVAGHQLRMTFWKRRGYRMSFSMPT